MGLKFLEPRDFRKGTPESSAFKSDRRIYTWYFGAEDACHFGRCFWGKKMITFRNKFLEQFFMFWTIFPLTFWCILTFTFIKSRGGSRIFSRGGGGRTQMDSNCSLRFSNNLLLPYRNKWTVSPRCQFREEIVHLITGNIFQPIGLECMLALLHEFAIYFFFFGGGGYLFSWFIWREGGLILI